MIRTGSNLLEVERERALPIFGARKEDTMSFRLFAHGMGQFHVERTRLPEGVGFRSLIGIRAQLTHPAALPYGLAGRALTAAAGHLSAIWVLKMGLTQLMATATDPRDFLSLSLTRSRCLFPDVTGFERIGFRPVIEADELIEKISRTLINAEMNYWGILRELGIVIQDYSEVSGLERYMLNIEVRMPG